MTEPIFDHDRLDVYRLSIDCVASSFAVARILSVFIVMPVTNGFAPHIPGRPIDSVEDCRRQWQTQPQGSKLISRYCRGSALQCALIQDVLAATDGLDDKQHGELKRTLKQIVSMLTRLIARAEAVSASSAQYNAVDE